MMGSYFERATEYAPGRWYNKSEMTKKNEVSLRSLCVRFVPSFHCVNSLCVHPQGASTVMVRILLCRDCDEPSHHWCRDSEFGFPLSEDGRCVQSDMIYPFIACPGPLRLVFREPRKNL